MCNNGEKDVLHIFEGQLEIRFTIYYPNSYYIFPSLAPPPPSRERACAKTRKERTRLDECVSRRARRRGIKKQRGVSLYYRVRACLLLLEVDLLSRERVALNATSFVWFPIVERAHTRATFDDDDDEGHRDDATSKHASVEKRVLCTAAEKSRVR